MGNLMEITGTLVADGNGNISGGMFDVNNPNGAGVGSVTVGNGSTYKVTSDGRGTATVKTTTSGTFGFDFVLHSSAGGLITEFDTGGTGSGTFELQSPVAQTDLAQAYALSLTGADSGINSMSTVAGFTLDAGGTMSNGVQDINDSRTVLTSLSLSGSVLVGAAGAPGTAQLITSTSLATLTFDVFPIDSNHLKFIETDGAAFLAGDAFPQSSIPASPSTYVFTLSGLDFTPTTGPAPFVTGGFLMTDGVGGVSQSEQDINDAGTVTTQIPFTGLYETTLTNGRTTVTLTGFNNGSLSNTTTFAAYPSAGGLQLLEIDTSANSGGVTTGVAYPQSATTLASGQGYGLNLTGSNSTGEEDVIAEFTNTNGNFSGLIDFNDAMGGGSLSGGNVFTATYAPDSSNSGRGQISSSAFNLISYVVNGTTTVFIEQDSNQVGVGSFSQQSTSATSSLAVRHLAVLKVKPGAKGALTKRH